MAEKPKVYLVGPLSGWRENAHEELKDFVKVYDPVIHSRQGCQAEYAPDDLEAVKKSDIVLAYQPGDEKNCLGMAVEATTGYCNNATVIYVDETGSLDPILVAISKRPFSDLNKAIEFFKEISSEE